MSLTGHAVDPDDRVAGAHARLLGRLAGLDGLDERALLRLQVEGGGAVGVDVDDVDPEEAADDLPLLAELGQDRS